MKKTMIAVYLLLAICLSVITGCVDTEAFPKVLAFNGTKTSVVRVTTPHSWTATSSASWISISPSTGTGEQDITLTIDRANLPPGNYEAFITVSAVDAVKTIPVFMRFPHSL